MLMTSGWFSVNKPTCWYMPMPPRQPRRHVIAQVVTCGWRGVYAYIVNNGNAPPMLYYIEGIR
jgi:hypothetical protein